MKKIFSIDYTKLVRFLIPVLLRQRQHVAWLQAVSYPVNYLYQLFLRNRDANIYRLNITPQVVFLEKLLNDRYDISNRRIRITDALVYSSLYLYQEEENKPVFFYAEAESAPAFVFTEEEVGLQTVDFYVLVPSVITFNENELRALLDAYKLAGKTYKIQRV